MKIEKKDFLKDLCLLIVTIGILFGSFLGSRTLMVPDEGRYAEITREMVRTADYLTPHLNGLKYFEKPPLSYWINAISVKVFGFNEWSLRLPNALLGLLGCLFIYWMGLTLHNRRTGLLAAYILATSTLYCTLSHFLSPDLPLCVFLTLCLGNFILGTRETGRRRLAYFLSMYTFAAFATLTKGLIGFLLPGGIIFIWILCFNQWRQLPSFYLIRGALLFILITAPWHILMMLKHPDFFQFYFMEQHFLRYFTDYSDRDKPIWFLSIVLVVGFFPWIWFLLTAWFSSKLTIFTRTHWQYRHQFKETAFLVLWALLIFIFFSVSNSQLISYALPILPPLALLTAQYLNTYWEKPYALGLKCAFAGIFISGCIMGIVGYFAVHPIKTGLPSEHYWQVSTILLTLMSIATLALYWKRGLKAGLIILGIGTGLTLMSLSLSYETLDSRPIKPLARILLPLLTPETVVISYRDYYQDLPVYVDRYVQIVNYRGELGFGIDHQDSNRFNIWNEDTAWKHWKGPARMFMIMGKKDYEAILQRPDPPVFFLLGQTTKNVLLTNQLPQTQTDRPQN